MGFGIFLGLLIIIIGLSIIINIFFHFNIPVFKICVGLFLIYLGARFIFGHSWSIPGPSFRTHRWNPDWNENWRQNWRSGDTIFGNKSFQGLQGGINEYNTVFGKVTVDLRGIELKEKVTHIKVNAVFGGAELIIDRETPLRIKGDTIFGSINMPDNNSGAFGTTYYESKNFDKEANYLSIEGACVFSGIDIHY